MEKNQQRSKNLVCTLVLTGLVWSGTILFADNKTDPKRTEVIYPDGSKATVGDKSKPHYEVVEKYQKDGAVTEKATSSGINVGSFGTAATGPNCSSLAVVNSDTIFTGYNAMQVENQAVKTSVNVNWNGGKNNAPEPKNGVNIYYHHNSTTYAEASGAGFENWVGSGHAKAEAKTQGPGGGTSSKSEAHAPTLGVKCDPNGQNATYVVKGAKSGHKDFITAESNATASSMVFGGGSARSQAEVKWEAEINKKEEKDEK